MATKAKAAPAAPAVQPKLVTLPGVAQPVPATVLQPVSSAQPLPGTVPPVHVMQGVIARYVAANPNALATVHANRQAMLNVALPSLATLPSASMCSKLRAPMRKVTANQAQHIHGKGTLSGGCRGANCAPQACTFGQWLASFYFVHVLPAQATAKASA